MESLTGILGVLIDFCLVILLIVLIYLGIKLIILTNKTEKILDSLYISISKLEDGFALINTITNKITNIFNSTSNNLSNFINKIFFRKGRKYYE